MTIEEFNKQLLDIQRLAYERGFEDGKRQALLSVTKVYEDLPAEYLNDGNN